MRICLFMGKMEVVNHLCIRVWISFLNKVCFGREKTKFQANVHTGSKDGFVKLLFKDVDVLNSSQEESAAYSSTTMIESTFAPFVKSTARTKGFLDYTNLLNVYFNKKKW